MPTLSALYHSLAQVTRRLTILTFDTSEGAGKDFDYKKNIRFNFKGIDPSISVKIFSFQFFVEKGSLGDGSTCPKKLGG